MLLLIGGASRSGKSLLASRLLRRAMVPWFPLDALRMGLARGAPTLRIDPLADDLTEARRLWPIVRALAQNLLADGRPYLIEGVCLDPLLVAELVAGGGVAACFLGYPRLAVQEKAALVARHHGGPNDWLSDEPPAAILAHCDDGRRLSALLERTSAAAGLPFFDTGADFEQRLAAAEDFLLAVLER